MVRDGQENCYASLGVADQSGDLTPFLRFMLAAIASACSEIGSEIATACGITAERILKLLAAEPRLPAGRMGSAGRADSKFPLSSGPGCFLAIARSALM